ncbi:MAG: Ig-like domain-containing protein [Gemmatimonadaceae bacterium]|nr:Ig-like domain-containing protein [Gemmatimonadaceae bacterium]
MSIGDDVTPPTVIAITPGENATDVSISAAPAVTFSEPMQNSTLTTTSFSLRTTAGSVPVVGTVSVVSNTATFTPTSPLTVSTSYTATITTAASDAAGNALTTGGSWAFTTEAAPVTSLVITPTPVSVATGGTQQFGVTGRRATDPTAPVAVDVIWTATGGTISASGLYTAGAAAGSTFTVTATLVGNPAVSAQANVTLVTVVSPPPAGTGVWLNVTPANADLTNGLSCGNFGVQSVQVDPNRKSDFYAQFNCQGIWKSVDFGRTWTGPINTGSNGVTVSDCAGGISVAPGAASNPPTLYQSCIRGTARGFWSSTDGGVNWTKYTIAPDPLSRQDMFPPAVDPYDPRHLIMAGHEHDILVESVDGGQNWTTVPLNPGMLTNGRTASINFINTGNAATTRGTYLWISEQAGGVFGTWRTINGGTSWVQVDRNEVSNGVTPIFQPDASGAVYMAGANSTLGAGVLRSADYGVTWSHVGPTVNQAVVFGSPRNIFATYGIPISLEASGGPFFQTALFPGTGTWTTPTTPAAMRMGGAQVAIGTDGTRFYMVSANYGAGLWLYIDP